MQLRQHPERGTRDGKAIRAILDEALVCHVGFVADGQPYVIPTIHARLGDAVYLHGSTTSRMIRTLAAGAPACLTVTLLDGLVLARSAFHHSMNYRSVVVLGRTSEVTDPGEKLRALQALVEHVVQGRWDDARRPTEDELLATAVLKLPIDEASAKIRTGPPSDLPRDLQLPVWAGEIPLELRAGRPVDAPGLSPRVSQPGYVRHYRRPSGAGG